MKSTDKQLQKNLKQLSVTFLNLKVVTIYAKKLVRTLAAKANRVIFSGKQAALKPEPEIRKSSKPLAGQKAAIQYDRWQLMPVAGPNIEMRPEFLSLFVPIVRTDPTSTSSGLEWYGQSKATSDSLLHLRLLGVDCY